MHTRRTSALLAASVAIPLLFAAPGARAQLAEFTTVPTVEDFLSVLAPGQAAPVGIANRSDIIMREIRDEPVLPGSPVAAPARPAQPPAAAAAPRPPRQPPHGAATAIAMPDIFALNSAELPPKTIEMLDNLAVAMARVPAAMVLITGHTDSTGPAAFNEMLSQRRAEAALRLLVERHGLNRARIQIAGLGAHQPIAGLDPAAPDNRRIQVWGQQQQR